ncbi:Ribonuclease BN-like family [Corynebacterium kutscheri]|uniref:Inner membrane protein YhjD n=1 Tax=Corynebacterium kutscheri TaxID=35755 RepID=A0A0F6QZE0_9CORY|nr:inner membrane protein YhjD [Corynebacterium kutscheri]VEH04749.1 Ribonuclease BN-like family [Corynebacterium kutscheri]VEH11062.1 Ribonuclease BN-like family [Corynebacterium kutscheri]VEH80460.1 Ribonuclease BN-like family [Corynebacterium kutscheri]
MVTPSTRPDSSKTDEYGIERVYADEQGFIDKYRERWSAFDHVMRMNERYTQEGGNQFSAGITYFSVLSLFPLLMLGFAVVATLLAYRPDLLAQIQEAIVTSVEESLADTLNTILDTAISQRNSMYGIGGITALWSGLNWMNNLRFGVSKMWRYPIAADNFFATKIRDLIGLIGMLLAFIIAFGVTAIGSSGLTQRILELLHLDAIPGISLLTYAITLVVGLIANFVFMFWLMKYLPRGKVPIKAAAKAAVIGAVAFEFLKQIGALFFTNALSNPAGATFGPIIGIMVIFYFVWRIVMYCASWAATTEEALAIATLEAPGPAIIRVREEVKVSANPLTTVRALIDNLRTP